MNSHLQRVSLTCCFAFSEGGKPQQVDLINTHDKLAAVLVSLHFGCQCLQGTFESNASQLGKRNSIPA